MNDHPLVDFSHLAKLPKGESEEILIIRETALEEAIATVIHESQKHGFDYSEVIMALSNYAFCQKMRTVELFLEAAYFEVQKFAPQSQTSQAIQETFTKIAQIQQ